MKRGGATREEIIRTTQELIARNGIRAVRVDEIAQTLGISKRTLYGIFADKTELVIACLDAMGRENQQRILAGCKCRPGGPMQRVFRLTDAYIESLYTVDRSFLADLHRKQIFTERFDEHRTFWLDNYIRLLEACRTEELLLPAIDTSAFAVRLQKMLFDLRLDRSPREELALFSRALLRGIASRKRIKLIDDKC